MARVNNPSTLWRLARQGIAHRAILLKAFACMAVLGATTGAYAYLLGPALRYLLSGGVQGLGPVYRLVPSLATLDRRQIAWAFPVAIVVIGLFKGASYLGQFYWMGWFGQRVAADLRRAVFDKLSGLTPIQMSRHRTGD